MMKNITFVLYLNQNSSSLDLCLNQLSKLDKEQLDVIVYLDSNLPELCATIENFFSNNEYRNFTLIKNHSHLGQAFCYNDAIQIATTKYIMFLNFNSIIDDNFLDVTSEFFSGDYDVISVESTNPNLFYNLISPEYSELTKKLILGATNQEVYDKIFNLEYLRNNEISFIDNKWYPDYFLLQVLLTFKMWKNILSQPVITFRKNPDLEFNLYDLLFQIKKMDALAHSSAIANDFGMELEYWYSYIAKYKFLSKIDEKYPLSKTNSKLVSLKNKEINKLAIKNVTKNIKLFCKNLSKNPYYKTFKKLLETYNKN